MSPIRIFTDIHHITLTSTPECKQTSTTKDTRSAAGPDQTLQLTYCARHHALSWHQVVIQALQATVQGVGDSALVVVEGRVRRLGSERTPRRLLDEEEGESRWCLNISLAFAQSLFWWHSETFADFMMWSWILDTPFFFFLLVTEQSPNQKNIHDLSTKKKQTWRIIKHKNLNKAEGMLNSLNTHGWEMGQLSMLMLGVWQPG